jgi:hypothetical protein
VSDSPKGNELCAKCSYTYDGHIGNTGCLYPCWTPSGRYRAVPPSPSGQPPRPMRCLDGLHQFTAPATVCQCGKRTLAPYSPPTGSDTRTLCAVCGIWQCLARHGGGTCHAVNGPADVSCGACYANRPTIKPDLTVASEEPPACRQRAASLHPRLGLSYACVLTAGHNGECAPGGTCYEHGPYIGKPRTTPLCPKCPTPSLTLAEEPLPKRLGKSWQWPTPEELVDWEAKITQRHTRAISPGNQLLLIRAVRGQRKVIEKLTKLLAQATP